jgi:rhamnosyltransferase
MQNKSKKIAVLLATFNGERYLTDQLDSILKQKDVLIDLYISDDCSNDNTKKNIESYANKTPNIFFINHKRIGGPSKNFYYLISQIDISRYDFVALCDQDDVWPEYRLRRAVEIMKKNSSDAYSSDVIAVDENMNFKKIIKKSQPQKKYDHIFETPGPGCSFVFAKNFFRFLQKELNRDTYNFPYHDWLIYALSRQNNFNWKIDDAPNLFYRQHNNNFMGANFGFNSRLKRINRILFGEYYKELIHLYKIINKNNKHLNFLNVWFFIIQFKQTRRKFRHALLMIPFLMIVSIQKNDG